MQKIKKEFPVFALVNAIREESRICSFFAADLFSGPCSRRHDGEVVVTALGQYVHVPLLVSDSLFIRCEFLIHRTRHGVNHLPIWTAINLTCAVQRVARLSMTLVSRTIRIVWVSAIFIFVLMLWKNKSLRLFASLSVVRHKNYRFMRHPSENTLNLGKYLYKGVDQKM